MSHVAAFKRSMPSDFDSSERLSRTQVKRRMQKAKKKDLQEEMASNAYAISEKASRTLSVAVSTATNFVRSLLATCQGAWVCKRIDKTERLLVEKNNENPFPFIPGKIWTHHELHEFGFRTVDWDGK